MAGSSKKKFATLSKNETDLFVSICNSLIEKMPQDEYCFGDNCLGYDGDGNVYNEYDDLETMLEWILKEVVPYTTGERSKGD